MTNKTKQNTPEDYIHKKIYDSNGKGSNTFSKDRYEKAFNAFVKLYHHFNDDNDPVVKEGNPSLKSSERFASQMLFASVSGLNLIENKRKDKETLKKIEKKAESLIHLLNELSPEYLPDLTEIIGPKDFRTAAFPKRALKALQLGASLRLSVLNNEEKAFKNNLLRTKINKYELLIDAVYTNWPAYDEGIPARNRHNVYKAIICVLQGAKDSDSLKPTSQQDVTHGVFSVDDSSPLYKSICNYFRNNENLSD